MRSDRRSQKGRRCRRDDGLPHGFAAGFVEYDGTFTFGLYDEALIYRHGDASWHELRSLLRAIVDAGRACLERCSTIRHRPRVRSLPRNGRSRAGVYRRGRHLSGEPRASVHRAVERRLLRSLQSAPSLLARAVCSHARAGRTHHPLNVAGIVSENFRTRDPDTSDQGNAPAPRGVHADEKSAYDLLTSPKEVAELVMITDLERNDLGMVCEYGSVCATELLKLERFEQVFHLVSTVEGRLRAEIDHVTALRTCFPGGSITGAPKKRAREIIAELEADPARDLHRRDRLARFQWRKPVQYRHPNGRPRRTTRAFPRGRRDRRRFHPRARVAGDARQSGRYSARGGTRQLDRVLITRTPEILSSRGREGSPSVPCHRGSFGETSLHRWRLFCQLALTKRSSSLHSRRPARHTPSFTGAQDAIRLAESVTMRNEIVRGRRVELEHVVMTWDHPARADVAREGRGF